MLSKFKINILLAFITVVFGMLILGCGKRTPPLPPIESVRQKAEIFGFQLGDIINLRWQMPARNADDSSIQSIKQVEVYRLAEPLDSSLSLTEEEFATRSTVIANVPVENTDFSNKEFIYTDKLDLAGQSVRLRYAIRFVNASGQKAGFSNFLLIEPTAKVSAPPSLLKLEVDEDGIRLKWTPPVANVDGSKPVNILGYNLYRKVQASEEGFLLLNKQPINKSEYEDSFFEFGKDYSYFVRAVSLGSNGEPVESLDSNIVSVNPKDIFAPSPPSAITIAAAPGNLSIFFAVNPEKDVAGYRIYRTVDPNLPKNQWQLLTSQLLKTNTYQDTKVESGKTYYYYLIAVDTAGNLSQLSEIVSETAP